MPEVRRFGKPPRRSPDPHLIFKDADPTKKPVFFGEIASKTGGKRLFGSWGMDADGQWAGETEEMGNLQDAPGFFYLPIFGGGLNMSRSDMREFVAGMRERREQQAKDRPPPPNLIERYRELHELRKRLLKGHMQFALGGLKNG